MSHVDDGRIHAWLDGAMLPDDPERVKLEAHLAECDECRALVDAEREIRDRAAGILGTVAPDAVRVEPFEKMIAARKAAHAAAEKEAQEAEPVPGKVDSTTRITDTPRRRRVIPLAWAATLVMAVTAGWFARSMMPVRSMPAESAADVDLAEGAVREQPSVVSPVPEEEATPRPATPVPGAREDRAEVQTEPRRDAGQAGRMAFADTQAVRTGVNARVQDPGAATVRRSNEETQRLAEAITADEVQLDRLAVAGAGAALIPVEGAADESASAMLASIAAARWESVSENEATARLGRVPARIEGLPVDSLQAALRDGSWLVRVVQRLESGEVAELVQWQEALALKEVVVTAEAERKAVALRSAVADSAARQAAWDSTVQRRAREADIIPAAVSPAGAIADNRSTLQLRSPGFRVLLRANVGSEELESLVQRIR